MFTLLRKRNFALLWFGGLISILGDRVLAVALPFYVYLQTNSTLVTGILVAAALIPRLLFSSFAGVWVDRGNRKRIMAFTSLGQGLVILPLLWVQSGETIWIACLVVFMQSILAVFFNPAEATLLPQLVEADQLLAANALNTLNNNIARLIGPLVGGVVLAFAGLPGVVLIDSLTFFIAAGMIALIRPPARTAAVHPAASHERRGASRFWKEWREGLRLIRTERVILVLFCSVVLLNFGGVMIDPLAAPFVASVVGANSQVYGLLSTTQAIGGITGGILAAKLGMRLSPVRVYGLGAILVGLLQLLRYNLVNLPVLFSTALFIGLPAALLAAALDTLFQQRVPNSHLGRILGVLQTVISMVSLVGVLGIAGLLGQTLGIVPVLNFAAGVTILAGVIALFNIPAHSTQTGPVLSKEEAC